MVTEPKTLDKSKTFIVVRQYLYTIQAYLDIRESIKSI